MTVQHGESEKGTDHENIHHTVGPFLKQQQNSFISSSIVKKNVKRARQASNAEIDQDSRYGTWLQGFNCRQEAEPTRQKEEDNHVLMLHPSPEVFTCTQNQEVAKDTQKERVEF